MESAWAEIARHIGKNASESVFPFLTTIYIYALARAGDAAQAHDALDQMRHFAARQTGASADVWHRVGVSLSAGCLVSPEKDYSRAAELIEPVLSEKWRGGGSDEQ